ncbi:MAG: hypothetical protein DMG06_22530 [Acidobacteria bacterium]|nr:MAG: hypothetical protein DMG06_22530 [Acidobacteriota bacterium]
MILGTTSENFKVISSAQSKVTSGWWLEPLITLETALKNHRRDAETGGREKSTADFSLVFRGLAGMDDSSTSSCEPRLNQKQRIE